VPAGTNLFIMSGSGGYYKYRCKYWLTFNCPHWVWVNNAPCAHCLADGRDSDIVVKSKPSKASLEIYVPQIENGAFQYTLTEIIAASEFDYGWLVKDKPVPSFPTSTEPSAVSSTAVDRLRSSKDGLKAQNGSNWSGGGSLE